jgi:hypothetical protein
LVDSAAVLILFDVNFELDGQIGTKRWPSILRTSPPTDERSLPSGPGLLSGRPVVSLNHITLIIVNIPFAFVSITDRDAFSASFSSDANWIMEKLEILHAIREDVHTFF